jgi:predicted nucleic acid-binding protein
MKKILVDTDIIIDYTKGRDKSLKDLFTKQDRKEVELYISPVVIAEFFADQNLKKEDKFNQAKQFIQLFETVVVTKNTGIIAGKLIRENKCLFLGDAMIAATCLTNGLVLFTRNIKHFLQVDELAFYQN